MAEVTVKRFTPQPPPTVIEAVTLTLSEDEAVLVSMLVGNVGGNLQSPLREAAGRIWKALDNHGLTGGATAHSGRYNELRAAIHIGKVEAL